MAFVEFKDVRKIYTMGEVQVAAVDGMSFEIEQGELVVVVGPSGSGKTTLLNMMGGMDSCTSGSITLDGARVDQFDEKQLTDYRRYDIGFVFQFYNLVQNLTALENVELASQICRNPLPPADVLAQVGLAHRMDNFPAQLSGGEQQRVAIARAIAKNPKLLLCDEPTGALDYKTGKAILKLLQDTCRETGRTVVLITHNSAFCAIADRVIHVKKKEKSSAWSSMPIRKPPKWLSGKHGERIRKKIYGVLSLIRGGRFLAIAIIAALGAGFYAGLRMTGPDMRLAGDEYYDGTSLADVRVVSTIGFDEAQIDALRDVEGVSAVMPAREADAISELDGVQYTLCFQSLDVDAAQASTCDDGFTVQSSDDSYLNRPVLKSGTWPTKSDECLLSSDTVWQTDVHIGDKVRLIEGTQDLDDSFAEREFTVVGFVNSSYYTCSTNVGSTSLGSGRLTSFVFVPRFGLR